MQKWRNFAKSGHTDKSKDCTLIPGCVCAFFYPSLDWDKSDDTKAIVLLGLLGDVGLPGTSRLQSFSSSIL